MKIGIFGGSFDPIHTGHLILAERCLAVLDEVYFVPAAISPFKQQGPLADARHRLEMLHLATAGNPHFKITDIELQRGGVSYTIDTLRQLHQDHTVDQLFLLIGDDALVEFADWREPGEICKLAIPIMLRRNVSPRHTIEALKPLVDAQRYAAIAASQLDTPLIEISATEIRNRVRQQLSIRYLLPRAVEKYIEAQGLYL